MSICSYALLLCSCGTKAPESTKDKSRMDVLIQVPSTNDRTSKSAEVAHGSIKFIYHTSKESSVADHG